MSTLHDHYEELLATYSSHQRAVELLRLYRPYFEKIPSIRRSSESIITIPLPVVKVRQKNNPESTSGLDCPQELIALPCDLAFLMCDPEWQIKTGIEVFIFIHRPQEELSHLLRRWRETQVLLSRGYSWEMPLRHQHIFNEGGEKLYPLFVLSEDSVPRIKRGLKGAALPFAVVSSSTERAGGVAEQLEAETSSLDAIDAMEFELNDASDSIELDASE
jgi:hypothetical protein